MGTAVKLKLGRKLRDRFRGDGALKMSSEVDDEISDPLWEFVYDALQESLENLVGNTSPFVESLGGWR